MKSISKNKQTVLRFSVIIGKCCHNEPNMLSYFDPLLSSVVGQAHIFPNRSPAFINMAIGQERPTTSPVPHAILIGHFDCSHLADLINHVKFQLNQSLQRLWSYRGSKSLFSIDLKYRLYTTVYAAMYYISHSGGFKKGLARGVHPYLVPGNNVFSHPLPSRLHTLPFVICLSLPSHPFPLEVGHLMSEYCVDFRDMPSTFKILDPTSQAGQKL